MRRAERTERASGAISSGNLSVSVKIWDGMVRMEGGGEGGDGPSGTSRSCSQNRKEGVQRASRRGAHLRNYSSVTSRD